MASPPPSTVLRKNRKRHQQNIGVGRCVIINKFRSVAGPKTSTGSGVGLCCHHQQNDHVASPPPSTILWRHQSGMGVCLYISSNLTQKHVASPSSARRSFTNCVFTEAIINRCSSSSLRHGSIIDQEMFRHQKTVINEGVGVCLGHDINCTAMRARLHHSRDNSPFIKQGVCVHIRHNINCTNMRARLHHLLRGKNGHQTDVRTPPSFSPLRSPLATRGR